MSVLPGELLRALRQRADDPERFIDMASLATFRRYPPATVVEIREAEERLGFEIPASLRAVYEGVANGGFGPGYGLLGVGRGAVDDRGANVERLYEDLLVPDPDDPTWVWRNGVLPFCYWGCVVYSCATADGSVVGFDEGRWVDEFVPMEQWLTEWIEGTLAQPAAG